jgi:nucleoside-diphosphate-sugar epimerase
LGHSCEFFHLFKFRSFLDYNFPSQSQRFASIFKYLLCLLSSQHVINGEAEMKILITGNMGYVGPCLINHLKSARPDCRLIGFDIGYFSKYLTNADFLPECLLESQIFGDIRTISPETLSGYDAVVHLAAISNDPMGNEFESITYDVNYHSSINIAKLARNAGVKRFIFASSCSMYGAADDSAKTEDSPLNPLTAYAISKVRTEKDLRPLADSNFKVSSLRFATACGMSDRLRLDLVLNDFVACALTSKKITILSDGSPWRPLINVKDMALAIEWALFSNQNSNDYIAVNVGRDDWNYQVKDLAAAVADVIPGVDVSVNQNAAPDKRSYRVDFSYYKSIAKDWMPKYDLKKTIEELKEGLEQMQFNDPNFRESYYMRLKVLKHLRKSELLSPSLEWMNK